MNNLTELFYDEPRGVVISPRGNIPVKDHKGWKYINYNGSKISVSTLNQYIKDEDHVHNYIFNGQYKQFPCPAMQYWIMKYRLKMNITRMQFKQHYSHCFRFFKPIPTNHAKAL